MKWQKLHIRQRIRNKRQRLTTIEQQYCATIISRRLARLPEFQQAQHIALYMSFNNEVSTDLILNHALALHKTCYLPIITRTHRLQFVKVDKDSALKKNCFGIFEPAFANTLLTAGQLDLVVMPLVAFDAERHRLGMGGGYYDRTFGVSGPLNRPCLVGLGYDFQRVNQLPFSNLDVSLDMIVTEKRLYGSPG